MSEIRQQDQVAPGLGGQGQKYAGRARLRVPPNLFGVPLGLAGLATAWHAAGAKLGTPSAVPDAIYILAAVVLLVLGCFYAAQGPRRMLADLRDPVQAPFLAVPSIIAMMLAAALASVSFAAGRALVVIFLAVTIAVAAWLGGQWIAGDPDQASVHPGYYLPSVAGGLVGAITLSQVHLLGLAEAAFGVGILSWVLLGSVVLGRLITTKRLPAALQPVTAIELAPPALAGVAWFALVGGRGITVIAYAIGGYLVLMALVQARLIPVYRKLRFAPGFWAFTFSYAIAITCALDWITRTNPPGATGYAIAAIAAITLFIGAIAARTLIAIARGQFLARPTDSLPTPRTATSGLLSPYRRALADGDARYSDLDTAIPAIARRMLTLTLKRRCPRPGQPVIEGRPAAERANLALPSVVAGRAEGPLTCRRSVTWTRPPRPLNASMGTCGPRTLR